MKQTAFNETITRLTKEGGTVYLVQMMRGTDNAYDEMFEPDALLITLDRQEALAFYEKLPRVVELEEPETDLEGNEKYLSPIVIEVTSYTSHILRG